MHVLLLEPDAVLARSYQNTLKKAGHSVDWAKNSQGAISLADKKSPDAVVLEVLVAQNNGIEFLYEFRSYSEWAKVPVLILSIIRPDDLAANVVWDQLKVNQFLYKPQATTKDILLAVSNVSSEPK